MHHKILSCTPIHMCVYDMGHLGQEFSVFFQTLLPNSPEALGILVYTAISHMVAPPLYSFRISLSHIFFFWELQYLVLKLTVFSYESHKLQHPSFKLLALI